MFEVYCFWFDVWYVNIEIHSHSSPSINPWISAFEKPIFFASRGHCSCIAKHKDGIFRLLKNEHQPKCITLRKALHDPS
jgi:hypothetical protein